jgi:hypothetical protein
MSYQISSNVGFGSKLKVNNGDDSVDAIYDEPITDKEGVIFGAFGDATCCGPNYGYYVMVKDAPFFDISEDNVMENNFSDWCIKIPNVEQYQLDLWRDKIVAFCAKRNIEFEEPSFMVVTYGG